MKRFAVYFERASASSSAYIAAGLLRSHAAAKRTAVSRSSVRSFARSRSTYATAPPAASSSTRITIGSSGSRRRRRRPGSTQRTPPPRERREDVNIGRWRRRRGNYSAESRNAKNIALQRSAASIGGKWPEPSNISISTRPPASR